MKVAADGLKVVDIARPTKRRASVQHGEETPAHLGPTAFCPGCKITTRMLKPKRRVSNEIAITSGRCADCKRETYRVGAAGSLSGDMA